MSTQKQIWPLGGATVINSKQKTILAVAVTAALTGAPASFAQAQSDGAVEEVIVTGIRSSLASALEEKRNSDNLKEVIQAVDIGKLPDQNLAEVLENLPGIQITRTAGIGTGVQIRGTNANRTEINGVSTTGSGTGRVGISFEDVNAAIISSVEVIKAPEAKTIEGSVGGTINLRTVRPLQLSETLGAIRIQGEESSLTTDGVQPRIAGSYGDNWDTDAGSFGIVISGSYTEQEAVSFRPRLDRDGSLVENINADVFRSGVLEDQPTRRPIAQSFDFLGIQFLNQEYENFEYETTNFATTLEWAPNDNLKFDLDVIINEQERRQDSTRVQASGVSSVLNYNLPTSFETVNFGSLDGVRLGSIEAALTGTIQPDLTVDDDDPNLRFNSDTGARITDSDIIKLGADWNRGRWSGRLEVASSGSDTVSPNLSTQLNFINPNPLTPLDNLDVNGNPTSTTSNDNSVPFIYDLRGNKLTFGVDFASPFAPTVADLLDPNNVVLDQVDIGRSRVENSEDAFRMDFTFDLDWKAISSIDFGYRYNETTSTNISITDRIGGFSRLEDSPNGSLFSELLVPGPSNFGSADGRTLAFRNFLIVDPNRSFNDPEGVIRILEDALIAHDPTPDLSNLEPSDTAFFEIDETTNALYAQANFDLGMFRGNFGFRYIDTDLDSLGNTVIGGQVTPVVTSGSYDFFLPRFNLVATPTDDVILRLAYGRDIRRPDFDILNTSIAFSTNENQAVSLGNPNLEPQEVDSFDISAEWYFAESAVASIGFFRKDRTNLFATTLDSAALDANGLREPGPNCPGGGIYNPAVQPNILGDPNTTGLCVDFETIVNDPAETTQEGIEIAFQYDLSSFEDKLGWASGFGVLANYTIQDFSGGSVLNSSARRGTDIFNAINGIYDDANFVPVTAVQGLLDFSENAYNITMYYEKYGLSARFRYTWREAFRTDDTAAGASRNSTLGFPVVTGDRGQLNASVNYQVNENLNVGVEAVNLTEEGIVQHCVNENALLCFQGIPDRRIAFGASYRF